MARLTAGEDITAPRRLSTRRGSHQRLGLSHVAYECNRLSAFAPFVTPTTRPHKGAGFRRALHLLPPPRGGGGWGGGRVVGLRARTASIADRDSRARSGGGRLGRRAGAARRGSLAPAAGPSGPGS